MPDRFAKERRDRESPLPVSRTASLVPGQFPTLRDRPRQGGSQLPQGSSLRRERIRLKETLPGGNIVIWTPMSVPNCASQESPRVSAGRQASDIPLLKSHKISAWQPFCQV